MLPLCNESAFAIADDVAFPHSALWLCCGHTASHNILDLLQWQTTGCAAEEAGAARPEPVLGTRDDDGGKLTDEGE